MSAVGFYLVARLSEGVIANLRQDMVGTASGLPTHQVEDAGTGNLVSRSTDDVAELSAAVTETLPTLSTSLFSIAATVIALSALDWHFLVIPVVVVPLYYMAARMCLARAPKRYAAERAAMAERARRVLEAIRGRATARAYSMEGRMHTDIENASWSVELRDVSFSYGSGWAVRDVNLTINPGETVAIVGASGAGKTTVAALLAGLRVPDAGEVLVDGYPVSRLSDSERIARIATVSQEVHVFSGTLRQDLTLAKPDATDAELLSALGRVHAHSWFDRLPSGLDTVVGSRGLQLEPVAAQQLALARILLLDPAIVVMDEATAEAGSAGAGALERWKMLPTR